VSLGGWEMARKYMDCRDFPSDFKCSIRISGEESEILRAACEHAMSVHGQKNTDDLKSQIRSILKDEVEDQPAYMRRTG
jgi:predicted small metal-binding protein